MTTHICKPSCHNPCMILEDTPASEGEKMETSTVPCSYCKGTGVSGLNPCPVCGMDGTRKAALEGKKDETEHDTNTVMGAVHRVLSREHIPNLVTEQPVVVPPPAEPERCTCGLGDCPEHKTSFWPPN